MASDTTSKASISRSILEEIEVEIEPWRTSKDEPPYSKEELIIMAVLMQGGKASEIQIHQWVMNTFSCYNSNIAEALWLSAKTEDGNNGDAFDDACYAHRSIAEAFQSFDLPLQLEPCIEQNHDGSCYDKASCPRCFSVSEIKGAEYLSDLFPRQSTSASSSCGLLALPAELRTVIYEMVFQYPKSGLHVELRPHNRTFKLLSKAWDLEFSWEGCADLQERDSDHPRTFYTSPIGDILRPLLVSEQIYTEAMPVFYSVNRFVCNSIWGLSRMLIGISRNNAQHLTTLCFQLNSFDEWATKILGTLAQLKHRKRLDIKVTESNWTSRGRPNTKKYSSIMNFPGIAKLCSIRGLEAVTFHGSPTLEREVKPYMLKPAKGNTARTSKKRKRENTEDGSKGTKVKKTRAKKA